MEIHHCENYPHTCYNAWLASFSNGCQHNAFLYGDLLEEVSMRIAQGFNNNLGKNKVCKFNKFLYGLKQASFQWIAKLTEALLKRRVSTK